MTTIKLCYVSKPNSINVFRSRRGNTYVFIKEFFCYGFLVSDKVKKQTSCAINDGRTTQQQLPLLLKNRLELNKYLGLTENRREVEVFFSFFVD